MRWSVIKRILKYIKGTSSVASCFRESKLVVRSYIGLKFGGYPNNKRSILGYVFTVLGWRMSWLSKLENVVNFLL